MSGCDPASCCCFTTASISPLGTYSYSLSGTAIGQCARSDPTYLFNPPTSNTIIFPHYNSYGGIERVHVLTRNPTSGVISDVDTQSPQCNAVFTAPESNSGKPVTVVMYSDSACSLVSSVKTLADGACSASPNAPDNRRTMATCFGPTWKVQLFTTSTCAEGSAAFTAWGDSKSSCSSLGSGFFMRAACDGSSLTYDSTPWMGQST